VEPLVHHQRQALPGHLRQRIGRAVEALATDPRPPDSRALDLTDLEELAGVEVRRLRLGNRRIVYAVHYAEKWVWVWAIRKRPPYNYEDLPELLDRIRSHL
jgi:mRNA interferase RelE/StbE